MQRNSSILDDLRYQFNHGTMSTKLIFVNIGVFVLFNIGFYLLAFLLEKTDFYRDVSFWFMVPASLKKLLYQPWSIITYMFMHDGILHILSNMLVLFIFGRILNDLLGNRKILPIYILGGLAGIALFLLTYNLFPVFSGNIGTAYLVGASAAVMAVMLAATTLAPDYVIRLWIIGDVKIKYIALVFVMLDLLMIPRDNPGGHIAHLGGALFGYLFIYMLQQGRDWSISFNKMADKVVSLMETPRPRVAYKKEVEDNTTRHFKRERVSAKRNFDKNKQAKIDAILDKIAQSGYDSLTSDEKAFLFKVSNEDEVV